MKNEVYKDRIRPIKENLSRAIQVVGQRQLAALESECGRSEGIGGYMYRQYEDPYKLQRLIAEARERLAEAQDFDIAVEIRQEIDDLEQRLNFAWSDMEEGMEE